MQQLRSNWVLAGAAFVLSLGGAAAARGLLPPLSTPTGSPEVPATGVFRPGQPSPAPLATHFTTATTTAPQNAGYESYRDAIRGLGLHEFYFTRAIYSGYRGYGRRGRGSWATDYPKADVQFLWGLKRLTNVDAYDNENAVMLTDPELRRFPFLYMLEVGYMQLTPAEVEGLRDYLAAGGFLFVDDFWGQYEWENFEWEIHKVLPGSEIVELSTDHPLFETFYDIDEILQVPNVRNGRNGWSTGEKGGDVPHVRAIFDETERLVVLINWNTDLGDAWEWAEDPFYPLTYSNYAYQLAVNAIVYAMSH